MTEPKTRGGLVFVFITVLLDVIGIGLVIPILPTLIVDLTGKDIADAAVDGGILIFIYAGMQFLFAPLIGNLSDRFGRRPVLLVSISTFGIDNLICALAPTLPWLFVGRLLAGISGVSATTAAAYIADISTAENRARNFGLMGMAYGIGFVMGPTIGGLLGAYGPRVPFYVAAGLSFANFLFGLFFLKESLPVEKRRSFDWRRANPLGALRQMTRFPPVMALAPGFIVYQIAHDANPSVWAFSVKLRFGWTEQDIGLSLAAVGILMAIVMGALVGPLVRRVGERRAALAGLWLAASGFLGFAFATEGWMLFPLMLPFAFIGLIEPALRALAAGAVPEDQQGELQGAIASVKSLTMVFSPILMTQLFSRFSDPDAAIRFPGAPFLLGALLLCCGAIYLTALWRRLPR